MIAPTLADADGCPLEISYVEYVADLACSWCGRHLEFVSEVPITYFPVLECRHCGGAVCLIEIEKVRKRKATDELYEHTRKWHMPLGRPPKWLVEQRRRESESDGQQSEGLV